MAGTAPPLIGITCFNETWEFDCGPWPIKAIESAYVDGLQAAGALVVMLTGRLQDVDGLLDRIDGLVMSGGPDVDPAHYGAALDPRTGDPDALRDAFEIGLVRGAAQRHMPVLGICRGIQLINVALGGSLHQHVEHAEKDLPRVPVHTVSVQPGSRLHAVVGTDELQVNSLHHQAVAGAADGLLVSGVAPDGGVEAVEGVDTPLLAVQWHPEMQQIDSVASLLFGWLVAEARRLATGDRSN